MCCVSQLTLKVQAVSCDEAFLDLTGFANPEDAVARLRADIEAATGCTASAGIGPNKLLARMATKEGKPNGQFRIRSPEHGIEMIRGKSVRTLPGVGHSLHRALKARGIETVDQLRRCVVVAVPQPFVVAPLTRTACSRRVACQCTA